MKNNNMNKKKIGILTHWSIPNFGSFLQAYSLRNVISSIATDSEVEQIAYMNKVHSKMYYGMEMHELYKRWFINLGFYKDCYKRFKRRKQIKAIRKFINHYYNSIPHSIKYTAKTIQKAHYDVLVLGSDILWDYSISFFDHDKFVFGLGIDSEKKISYAASFGTVKPESNHPQYVITGINELNDISVRDVNSKIIVEKISGKKAQVVLDPTLLWDFDNDEKIIGPNIDCKYVAVYGSFFTEEQINFVKVFCRENSYKIIYLDSVGDTCSWCDVFVDASSINPFEWAGYIKHCEFLMTCTFHGLMFGLIFNKKIVFNATQFMKDKASSFIKEIGMEEKLLSYKPIKEIISLPWDYDTVNKKIEALKKESMRFLRLGIGVDNE